MYYSLCTYNTLCLLCSAMYAVASEPGGPGDPGPLTFWRGGADVVCAPPPVFDRFKFYILTERVTNSQMITKELVNTC